MKAGFSKIDITPDEPVPLAGYFHLKDRISRRIRDRLYCRTIAFDDGKTRVALVSLDLLLVTPDLFSALNAFFRERNVFLVIHATHTHSSFGGIWNTLPARMSLGSFRKSLSDRLKERVKRGVLEALDDLREAEIGVAACAAPGLNGNRRTPEGPVDDELIVVRIQREKDQGVLVNYPAHPVIVAERDHHAISADFPGVATAMLENSGFSFAAYLNGALGGVDVLFPAGNIGLEENLQIMAGPLAVKSLDLARKSVVRNSSIRYASETIKTPSVDSNPFFDDRKFLAALSYPLRLALNAVFSSAGITETVMNAFSVGEVLF
ncbi:MAG: neutral/alkaline non-lysosomal ceramidase N-terminal domain-containing protein, partial [Deltaproteobacteria bacterium]|nr:neutral/alkaline non-lysosomal ceramidase N-terminal domain-containing protein [Deltaproteobacteria bacterium]